MNSLILETWTRLLKPMMLLFSVFLLLRGHNEPGGGFVGGLVAATAITLHALAFGLPAARRALRFHPLSVVSTGLLVALASGLVAGFVGMPFMTGLWGTVYLPLLGEFKLGTPLVFDIGVYLLVLGMTLALVFAMMERFNGE